ncbi:Inherit from NOG: domain protein [Seminavis robusta]|uniref:Inherit from NOG: domain protein n=1 Tax=Seminavis robusta TaxID=568900 RepID=A0A9N8E958_9STRA|nr:Inherit from NOG: domain protein [Seminavis robusta]|eukprot:Sro810_g205790.1 Inherit from NOG: domain protein (1034) ;mRNA; r:29969-33070
MELRSQLFPFILLLIVSWSRQNEVGGSSLSTDALARYTFTTAACNEGSFPDTAHHLEVPLPSLGRNREYTKCSKGLGVEAVPYVDASVNSNVPLWLEQKDGLNDILQHVARNDWGISFELWLKPIVGDEPRVAESVIFAIGSPSSADEDKSNDCDELGLWESNGKLQISLRTSDPFVPSCVTSLVSDFSIRPGKLIHLVISIRDGHQRVFVNGKGQSFANEHFSLDSLRSATAMTFFSSVNNSIGTWQGSLYQFSIYDNALLQTEVEQSLTAGLVGDIPHSIPYEVVLNEDAEAEPESHPIEWYFSPQSVTSLSLDDTQDIQKIPLSLRPVQDEINTLLAAANLTLINDNTLLTVFAYITALPSKGSLFHHKDEGFVELHHTNDEPFALFLEDPDSLVYLPTHSEHSELPGSVYTTISYCVSTRVIFDPVQCDPSVISIVVDEVNDPPIAIANPASLQAVEGGDTLEMASIQLGGSDVDRQDSVTFIQITSPPKWGKLMLRVTTFRDDGLPHGTLFSPANNFTVASHGSSESVYVKYLFNGIDPGTSQHQGIPGNDAMDYFRFRVSDQQGAWSLEQTVHIDIMSAVETVTPKSIQKLSGDEPTAINFNATDASGYERPLALFFDTIPNEDIGWLVETNSNSILRPGSVAPVETALSFLPNASFCSDKYDPGITTRVNYRAVALMNDKVTSVSTSVIQSFEMQCPKPIIDVTSTSKTIHLYAFSLYSINQTNCRVPLYESLHSSESRICDEAATVDGVRPISATRRSLGYEVVVTVLPESGYITFSEVSWHKVRLFKGRRAMASENVTFAASLEDLEEVFDGMTYRSILPGNHSLEITIQYEGCLVNEHFNQTESGVGGTGHDESCPKISLAIPVIVEEGDRDDAPVSIKFPIEVVLPWFGYPLVYFLWFYVEGLRREIKRFALSYFAFVGAFWYGFFCKRRSDKSDSTSKSARQRVCAPGPESDCLGANRDPHATTASQTSWDHSGLDHSETYQFRAEPHEHFQLSPGTIVQEAHHHHHHPWAAAPFDHRTKY